MLKKLLKIIKRIVVSSFLLYGYNLLIQPIGLIVPINVITVGVISILGIPAMLGLIFILAFIY